MKYLLFRSSGNLDHQIKKHELVAVVYGSNIDSVTSELIQAVANDLEESPQYAGCETTAYVPERIPSFRWVKRYSYEMLGVVSPANGLLNIIVEYGIIETPE